MNISSSLSKSLSKSVGKGAYSSSLTHSYLYDKVGSPSKSRMGEDDWEVERGKPIIQPSYTSEKRVPQEEEELTVSPSQSGPEGQGGKRMHSSDHPALKGYLIGQLANASSFGVWWTLFSPIIISLFSSSGVGASRFCYNGALFFLSPIAGALAERISLKKVLNITTAVRLVIYGILLPIFWVLFRWHFDNLETVFYALFLVLMLVDGCFVSFLNVVSTDCGGLDLLAAQHDIEIDDGVRNRFNSLHQAFFDGSMIILSPVLAIITKFVADRIENNEFQPIIMIGVMGGVMLVLGLTSFIAYSTKIPTRHSNPNNQGGDATPMFAFIKEIALNIWEGLLIFVRQPRIRWRLVFLALETALEDSMVSLIIMEFAITTIAGNNVTDGNMWGNVMIAAGKIGAVAAAVLMNKYWVPPENSSSNRRAYAIVFSCATAGGLSSLLIPLSYHIHTSWDHHTFAIVVAFIGSFMFFSFITVPKIGFATLLQALAAEQDASGRIFGFAATFITATDAIILLGLSQVFQHASLHIALWTAAGLCALVGVLEGIFGPYLMIADASESQPLLSKTIQ